MLVGRTVALRARLESDVAVLHAGIYDDVLGQSESDNGAWRPVSPTVELSPYRVRENRPEQAPFTIVALDDQRIVGEALLWGIDAHNRGAHLGIALLPHERGRGHGLDTVQVLCRYAFRILGLHRVQMETNTPNVAMRAMAKRAGFTEEGVLRHAAWFDGRFVDEVVLGLVVDHWTDVAPPAVGGA
jgi:RimJ/RimL family protein N-acetyltransferase